MKTAYLTRGKHRKLLDILGRSCIKPCHQHQRRSHHHHNHYRYHELRLFRPLPDWLDKLIQWNRVIPTYLFVIFINTLTISICGPTALVNFDHFFSFLIWTQSVGLLGRGISPSQGRYLHPEQHTHRINAHRHPCRMWDLNPDPSARADEDGSCLKPRRDCDQLYALNNAGYIPSNCRLNWIYVEGSNRDLPPGTLTEFSYSD
jgi:hypothetical protein